MKWFDGSPHIWFRFTVVSWNQITFKDLLKIVPDNQTIFKVSLTSNRVKITNISAVLQVWIDIHSLDLSTVWCKRNNCSMRYTDILIYIYIENVWALYLSISTSWVFVFINVLCSTSLLLFVILMVDLSSVCVLFKMMKYNMQGQLLNIKMLSLKRVCNFKGKHKTRHRLYLLDQCSDGWINDDLLPQGDSLK